MISISNIKYNKDGKIESCDIVEMSVKEKEFRFGAGFSEGQKGITPPEYKRHFPPPNSPEVRSKA